MTEPISNGRRLKWNDPLALRIREIRAETAAAGLPYPWRKVDDYFAQPFVVFGRVSYDAHDLTKLLPSNVILNRPVDLPDHFVFDGESRLPLESKSNYTYFLAYRDLGPERSFAKMNKVIFRNASQQCSRISLRYYWIERCAAWDAKMEAEMRRSMQRVVEDRLNEEVARRDTYLNNEWEVVEKGFHILKEMLNYPVVEKESTQTSKDGKTIITVWKPGKWTLSSVSQLMDTLTKVGRLHSGLSTSNSAQKIDANLSDSREANQLALEGDELAMHTFASQKAEAAYFDACEEWKARKQEPIKAMVTR